VSDLRTFRDHADRMATAEHKPECQRLGYKTIHGRTFYRTESPDPLCPGCVTEADRVLWRRLADEVDAYLSDDEEGLFG
jgi:hypothetical protein